MTEKVRKEIMMKFLRTVVWIDDEIRPDNTEAAGDPFRSFFYPTAQEFQKKQLLIHLHPYNADTLGEGDNTFDTDVSSSFESAATLAKKADVVVLDWHLGRDDPKNSIQLLKSLEDESAIRYIVVLSKFAERFEEEMERANMLAPRSGAHVESHVFQKNGNAWENRKGTHIIVMEKPDPLTYSAGDFTSLIIEAIYNLMSKANPDYLHWAAIEIAAKLRHSIPEWVQAIPCGTDAAVLSELGSERTEARDFIPKHLLEDLSHIAKLHLLESLNTENCKPVHWINRTYVIQELASTSERFQKFTHFSLSSSGLKKKDVDKLREKSEEDEAIKSFVSSQQTFSEFCENLSSVPDPSPDFGAIYISEQTDRPAENGEMRSIYLCLSQECDALRSDSLMLLEGKADHGLPPKEGVTKLSLRGETFGFLPEAQSLQSVVVTNVGSGENERRLGQFKKVGQLRKAAARHILSKFWNHISRPAVNLPRFTLKDRDEE